MDTNEYFNSNQDNLTITPEIKEYLRESAKWCKLLSIVGFVMMALLVFLGLFMGTAMAAMSGMGAMEGIGAGFVTVFYILMALIYFFPLLYLYRFASKIKTALNTDDQYELTEGFKSLKSLYKFMGIFTVVMLVIYALIFGFTLLGGLAAMM